MLFVMRYSTLDTQYAPLLLYVHTYTLEPLTPKVCTLHALCEEVIFKYT